MFTIALVGALACAALTAQDALPVNYPHPLITEILFAVPKDSGDDSLGDANLDGERDATGDEFIELINPHDEPIDLAGYTVADAHPRDKNRFEFTFPELVLEPGQTAVVFNGKDQRFADSTGDDDHAGEPQPDFYDAYVFDAGNDSRSIGLANKGDAVVLIDPDGVPLCFIHWGSSSARAPAGCPVVEAPNTTKGSVVLDADEWEPHTKADGVPYSPGIHPMP